MFREQDEKIRHLHASYRNKAIPTLQQIAQTSKIDDGNKSARASFPEIAAEVPVVPAYYDTYFDPNHPDADWTGQVSLKNNQKKHSNDHVSQQIGITQCEHGLMSKDEKQEWSHRRQPMQGSKNNSTFVIGGIDCGSSRYVTEHARFDQQEGTKRDQLILERRTNPIKMIKDPAQARVSAGFQQTSDNSDNLHSQIISSSSFRAPSYNNKSMIANISSHLVHKIYPPSFAQSIKSSENNKPGDIKSTATLINSSGSYNNRILVADNYNPFPGNITINPIINLIIII